MYLIGMYFRRKLKKIVLLIFFAIMIIKIHKDYQELNKVNEKNIETIFAQSNDSSHPNIINLNNIQDILLKDKLINKSQRNFPVNFKETLVQAGKTLDLPLTLNKNTTNIHPANLKEDKSTVDNKSYYDNRIHYNPSFKKKMEEAVQRKLENAKSTNIMSSVAESPKPKVVNSTKTKEIPKSQFPLTQADLKNESSQTIKTHNETNYSKTNVSNKILEPTAPRKIQKIITRLKDLKNKIRPKSMAKTSVFKVSHVVDSSEISFNESEILRIKNQTERLNEEQHIYNENIFGNLTFEDTVIVVQVHNRLENLKYLVESLTNVKYINTSVVIFSHDFWDDNINNFVRSISAFKVMQIFFPYSIQMNPFTFPGRDPRDCVWNQHDLNKQLPKDKQIHCLNSNWPDTFGHYREASFTQIKHHWWWKLFQIFERIRKLQTFSGQVMFLEEDHFVIPDILHMLKLLVKEREKTYNSNYIFGLGNYQRQVSSNSHLIERGDWVVNKHNLGFAFNRSIYNIIKECQSHFCNYDDYNWDWTLAYIVKTCALNKLPMLSAKLSRVLHIGSCGTHYRKENCILSKEVITAKEKIKGSAVKLFPKSISVQKTFKNFIKPKKMNGGWGDFRDKKLCLAFANNSDINNTLDKLQFHNISMGKSAS